MIQYLFPRRKPGMRVPITPGYLHPGIVTDGFRPYAYAREQAR
jgi:hypothetical protein